MNKLFCCHNISYGINIPLSDEELNNHKEDCCKCGDNCHPCGYKTIQITYDELNEHQKKKAYEDQLLIPWMRCSEHCGNIVRDNTTTDKEMI